jgi:hypothetical protein
MAQSKKLTLRKYKKEMAVDGSSDVEQKEGMHTDLKTDAHKPENLSPGQKPLKKKLKYKLSSEEWEKVKKKEKKNSKGKMSPKLKKRLQIGIGIFSVLFILLGLLGYFYVYIPFNNIRNAAVNVRNELSLLSVEFESKDLSSLDTRIENIKTELQIVDDEIAQYQFLQSIPLTAGYYDNLQTVQEITRKTDNLFDATIPELKRVLELTGFKTDTTTVLVTGNEDKPALALVMSEMPQYLELYEDIEPELLAVLNEFNNIDPDYITPFGVPDFGARDALLEVQQFVREYPETADQTVDFLSFVPTLIGAEGEASYLVILQNEAEMRASGGLLTSYGHMTIKDGELQDEILLSDMWNLEIYVSFTLGIDTGYRNIYGQNFLMNQGCGSNYLRAQDSGIYPDLHWTMTTLADYYDIANEFNKLDYPDYDHIVILNQTFAENLIGIIEPLEVEGFGEVTGESLFEFIKSETDDPSLSFSPERKQIIEDIANAAKEKFFELELENIPNIVQIFTNSIYAKDFSLASETDLELQAFFDKYGITGRITQDFDGDYFHLNEAQNCSLKLNLFVRNSVDLTATINEDGSIDRDVYVHWTQEELFDEERELQYSDLERFSYRAWVRIFAPPGVEETAEIDPFFGISKSFETDGLERSGSLGYIPQEYYDEVVNKYISDNVIRFDHRRFTESDPIAEQELNVSYSLPNNLNYIANGNTYELLIQKHPGKSWGEEYTVTIDDRGQTYTTSFVLNRDKVVTYQNGIISVENYENDLDWIVKLVNRLRLDS